MAVDLTQVLEKHFSHIGGNWAARSGPSQQKITHSLSKPHYLTTEEAGRCIATERGWELIPPGQTMVGRKSTELLQAIPGLTALLDVDNMSAPQQALFNDVVNNIGQGLGGSGFTAITQAVQFTGAQIARRTKQRYVVNVVFSENIVFASAGGGTAKFRATFNNVPQGTNDGGVNVHPTDANSNTVDYDVNVAAGSTLDVARVPFMIEYTGVTDGVDAIKAFEVSNVIIVSSTGVTAADRQGTTIDLGATVQIVNGPYDVSYGTQW
jgi:hypothetical protein